MSRFNKKVNIILAVAFSLAAFSIGYALWDNNQERSQKVEVGVLVRVKFGYYEGCKGLVLKEVYSEPVTDRYGTFHPSIFAGYAVDITCNNEHTGDRFFSPDFLRVVRK